jgi:hypothetical protein
MTKKLIKILSGILFLSSIGPVAAHNIKTDADVGATFHIEPNHNPRAGEPARAWFALTRQGGELIPLNQCNCQLTVRPQSPDVKDSSILNPPLKAVSAEQYQDIPGADIVFPKAGIYELEIGGTPKGEAKFNPFKLTYSVTVLPGKTASQESSSEQASSETTTTTNKQNERQWIVIAIASVAIISTVSIYLVRKQSKFKEK